MTLPLCHSLLTLSALSCLSLSLSLFPSLLVSVILSKAQSDKWDGTKSLFRVRVTLSHCFKNVTTTCFLTTRELLFNFGISEFVCIRITLLHPPIYFSWTLPSLAYLVTAVKCMLGQVSFTTAQWPIQWPIQWPMPWPIKGVTTWRVLVFYLSNIRMTEQRRVSLNAAVVPLYCVVCEKNLILKSQITRSFKTIVRKDTCRIIS